MVWIRIGHVRSRSPRKRRALAAVLWRYMPMKTRRLTLSIVTKKYPRDVSLAMCGGYFTSMWTYPGSGAFKPLCLSVSSLALRSRRRPAPCRRRQGSRPERDIVGFRNFAHHGHWIAPVTTVTFHAVQPPRPLALVSGWSEGGGGGCDPEHCRVCAISRQSAQWLRGVLPRPRRFITRLNGRRYLWCCCRLTMTSNKHWCRPSEYPPSTDLARKPQNDEGLCDHPGWNWYALWPLRPKFCDTNIS